MEVSGDELAGVVDLFGALRRGELERALAELAFKRDGEFDPDGFAEDVDAALDTYHLLAVDRSAVERDADGSAADARSPGGDEPDPDEATWLVAGPLAFPELPDGATDLPHVMEPDERGVDREAVARAAEERFRTDAASAAESGDTDRIAELLDASYELESWAAVDLSAARERLDAAESSGTN